MKPASITKTVTSRLCVLFFAALVCGQTDWKLESPLPTWRNICDCVWAGDKFIAVGAFGLVLTSPDGSRWKKSATPTNNHLRSVAWTGSVYAAVGDTGVIITSKDAITWTSVNSGSWKHFKRVIWNGSLLVLVGDARDGKPINTPGSVYTSVDGTTWTLRNQGTTAIDLKSVIWTGQKFVAAGSGGRILFSPDGIEWTTVSTPYSSMLFSIAYSGALYAATGYHDTLLTSADGAQWTIRTTGFDRRIRSMCYGPDRFVAVGDSGIIITSNDGIAWNTAGRPTPRAISGVVWSGKTYCAVGDTGTVLASSGGLSWSLTSTSAPFNLRSIIWANNQFVAPGDSGNIHTSPDGLVWTKRITGTNTQLGQVSWTGAQLVAIGYNGPILTSPDGMNWNIRVEPSPDQQYVTVAGNESQVVALGKTYDNGLGIWRVMYTSPDGVSWTTKVHDVESSSPNSFGSMVWTGKYFVAVGDGVFMSGDGKYWNEWSRSYFDNSGWTTCVAAKASSLYVSSSGGSIFCYDSGSWKRVFAEPNNCWFSLCWTGRRLIAVGYAGRVIASSDGSKWTPVDLGYGETPNLNRIVQTPDRTFIFGDNGLVLSAPVPSVSTLRAQGRDGAKSAVAGKLVCAAKRDRLTMRARGCSVLGRRIVPAAVKVSSGMQRAGAKK